jgi:dipeptide transport system permease protein
MVTLIPAFALALTLIALNAFGDGLRDALDPRMRR